MTADSTTSRAPRGRYLLPLLFIIALVGVFFYALFSGDPSKLPSALIGKPAPQFDLPPIAGLEKSGQPGKGFSTADLETGEVTIVNIFASWCGPCIQEHPVLVWLKEQRHDLRLVGINYKDQPEKALQFLERLGDPYDRIGADRNGRVAIDWGVYGVPETYVVDGRGEVVYRYVGPLSEKAVREELLPAVDMARERTRTAAAAKSL
jgi:cytochrome c biogenesis protein CcmG, thiol:disulfide interchange protein DsbE